MNELATPLVILVVGRPASGKTTIAKRLADRFELPLLAKDDFKEILFDRLGVGDRAWSTRLGRAAFDLLDHAVEEQLKARAPFIVEAAYDAQYEDAKFQAWQQRYGFSVLQLHCVASDELLVLRFTARAGSGLRHAGHVDDEGVEEFRAGLLDGRTETLQLEGQIIELDSTLPGAVDDVEDRVAAALGR